MRCYGIAWLNLSAKPRVESTKGWSAGAAAMDGRSRVRSHRRSERSTCACTQMAKMLCYVMPCYALLC